eukprot:TRINITY_DN5774_c0_g1_i1.p1 TRINITY_DN5774_c0_g1~~TRINITY_DN5774_c0_g1_i1.p1  ORF type:complete len:637 (-),score=126.02 TRINITY_DN5774_c0_g1_i1:34-1944(-)
MAFFKKFGSWGAKEDSETLENAEPSRPYNAVHKVHVNTDFNWTGQDPLEIFRLEKKVGEGSFGSVYKAVHKDLPGFVIAMKCIQVLDDGDSEDIAKEINLLKKCRNNHIVNYYGSYFKEGKVWILMDYCGVGSMRDIIETLNKPLNEEQLAVVLRGTLIGLVYLHTAQNIVHRDLKAANILLSEDAQVKIADFGVSDQIYHTLLPDALVGTPLWMAPEVIKRSKYNYKADVWSLGITAIEMADGRPPHTDMHPLRAMVLIPNKPPPTLADPSKWSPELNDFIAKCCIKEYTKRPSATDLLTHPFIMKAKDPNIVLKPLIAEMLIARLKAEELAAKTPSPSYKLQSHSAVTFVNNSHSTKQRTKNNKTVANPMSATANGTSTMSGTFVEKSHDPDASKNSDDEDEDDEGTLIIRGDSVESMGFTETAIIKTTVEKDTQKRPVSSKISEIAKGYENMQKNNATNTTKSSMGGTANGTFVVNGTDTNNTSPRLSTTTPRQSVTSPFGSKRFEGMMPKKVFIDAGTQTDPVKTPMSTAQILSIVAIVLSVLLSLSLLSIYGLDPLGKSLGGAYQSVKDIMTPFFNDLLGIGNSDPMVIEHGTDEFSPKVWQGVPRQLDVNSKTNDKPLDEDNGGSWWSWN